MKRAAAPISAIVTGLGVIYFGVLARETGIFAYSRKGGFFTRRHEVITAADDPERFSAAVLLTLVLGVVAIVWGLVKLVRR